MQLTSIKNLLGRQGGHFLLFGMLTRTADGSFALEDLDDRVELDLAEAQPASGMFTEGCFALVDGLYTKESIFKVYEIGHPPSEKREVTRYVIIPPLGPVSVLTASSSRSIYGHVDFLGTGSLTLTEEAKLRKSEEAHPDQFLIFSDLHLDSPKDMLNFRQVLQVYEGLEDGDRPSVMILCGNFASKPFNTADGRSLQAYRGKGYCRYGCRMLAKFCYLPRLLLILCGSSTVISEVRTRHALHLRSWTLRPLR